MSYLIFTNFEVGGIPYKIADILNNHGLKTYYISIANKNTGHDSKAFHYGDKEESWELSHFFTDLKFPDEVISTLQKIRKELTIQSCFATGWKSYVLRKAGFNYAYWCFGADLDQICFEPFFKKKYPLWKKFIQFPFLKYLNKKPVRLEARMSIQYSDSLIISPYQKDTFNKLDIKKRLNFLPHILKIDDFVKLKKEKEESRKKICERIGATDYIFSSTRHIWCGNQSVLTDNKGNDIILNAFKTYISEYNNPGVKLVFVEKGEDVAASKSLSREMGIADMIVWLPEMPRDELWDIYKGAALCMGQFATPCITYSVLEPIVCATPCISYYHKNHIISANVPYYEEMPPVMDSKEPDEIAELINSILSDKKFKDDLVYKSWAWARDFCSEEEFVKSFQKMFVHQEAQ